MRNRRRADGTRGRQRRNQEYTRSPRKKQQGYRRKLLNSRNDKIWKEEIGQLEQEIWENKQRLASWIEAFIYPIYKKGEKPKCDNFSPIVLLDVVYKKVAVTIKNMLEKEVKAILREYRCGFTEKRAVFDQIFSIKQIQQLRQNLTLHIVVVDFKQPCHSVNREVFYKIMEGLKTLVK